LVVKVLRGAGVETAVIAEIESIKKNVIRLVDCRPLLWNAQTLREIDPLLFGFFSYLVPLDGGEEEQIRKGFGK